jgi:hypothetical protein
MIARTAFLVLLVAPLCSGCVAVAAAGLVGVGVVQYERNEAEQDFPTNLECTWRATLEALQRLEIEPEESLLEATEGRVHKEGLQVVVEQHPDGFTRVRVRVNTFHSADNERRAQLLLQEIERSVAAQDELRAWVEKDVEPVPAPAPVAVPEATTDAQPE